jgi:hypothetical protein
MSQESDLKRREFLRTDLKSKDLRGPTSFALYLENYKELGQIILEPLALGPVLNELSNDIWHEDLILLA